MMWVGLSLVAAVGLILFYRYAEYQGYKDGVEHADEYRRWKEGLRD